MRNFHLPLPEDLDDDLRGYARAVGKPATLVAREALATYLKEKHREKTREEIEVWALAHAGSDVDLDEGLEVAGVEMMEDEG